MNYVVVAICAGITGTLTGTLILPMLANTILQWKYRRITQWWNRGCECFTNLKSDTAADQLSKGEIDTAYTWEDEVRRSILNGSITRERAEGLKAAGFKIEGYRGAGFEVSEVTKLEADEAKRYSFEPTLLVRILCAQLFALIFLFLTLIQVPPILPPLLYSASFVIGVLVICDMRARIIPTEVAIVLLVVAMAFRLALGGLAGLGVGIALMMVVFVLGFVSNGILSRFIGGLTALGAGDIRLMAVLAMLCGFRGSIIGATIAYGCAAIFCIIGLVSKKRKPNDSIPMAPFLALWAIGGVITSLTPYWN